MANPMLRPGAAIIWTHVLADGSTVERTGQVWSLAPLASGVSAAYWVAPITRLPGDRYGSLYVARSAARLRRDPQPGERDKPIVYAEPGVLHSCDDPATPTGGCTARAAQLAQGNRSALSA